jgi:beta-glucosidase/6-phospho-beta-glucosidase/beta-galactosidase
MTSEVVMHTQATAHAHPVDLQVEGASDADGRAASIWDTFSATSGKVAGNDTGSTAADHYHLFQHDVQLLSALGIKHYRWGVHPVAPQESAATQAR